MIRDAGKLVEGDVSSGFIHVLYNVISGIRLRTWLDSGCGGPHRELALLIFSSVVIGGLLRGSLLFIPRRHNFP